MRLAGALTLVLLAAACAAPAPSPSPSPSPSASPGPTFLPLPQGLAATPGPDDPAAVLTPHTPRGELQVGVPRDYELAHCGLGSPVDIDGSLWMPVGGHNGEGGPLTEEQVGDLINGTQTIVTLLDPDTLEMRTQHGAIVLLERLAGGRAYFLCA